MSNNKSAGVWVKAKYKGDEFPEFIGQEILVTDDYSNPNAPCYKIRFVGSNEVINNMSDEDIEWLDESAPDLLKAHKDYIAFLENESSRYVQFAGIHGMKVPDEVFKKGEFLRSEIKNAELIATSPTSIPDTSSLKEGEVVYQAVSLKDELPPKDGWYSVLINGDMPDTLNYEKGEWIFYEDGTRITIGADVTHWIRPVTIPSSSKEPGSREVEGASIEHLLKAIVTSKFTYDELDALGGTIDPDKEHADDYSGYDYSYFDVGKSFIEWVRTDGADEHLFTPTKIVKAFEFLGELLNKDQNPQECDASKADSSNTVGSTPTTPDTTPSKESEAVERLPKNCKDKKRGKSGPCKYPLGSCQQCRSNH